MQDLGYNFKNHKDFCRLLQYSSASDLLLQLPVLPTCCTAPGDVSSTY